MYDIVNFEKDEILKKISEALTDNNFEQVDTYIKKYKDEYPEPLRNIVYKIALYTDCIPYVESVSENIKLNDINGKSSYFEYAQSEDAKEILLDCGAIPMEQ